MSGGSEQQGGSPPKPPALLATVKDAPAVDDDEEGWLEVESLQSVPDPGEPAETTDAAEQAPSADAAAADTDAGRTEPRAAARPATQPPPPPPPPRPPPRGGRKPLPLPPRGARTAMMPAGSAKVPAKPPAVRKPAAPPAKLPPPPAPPRAGNDPPAAAEPIGTPKPPSILPPPKPLPPPPPRARGEAKPPELPVVEAEVEPEPPPPIPEELERRAQVLMTSDSVGAARAFVERGLYAERVAGDLTAARKFYSAARAMVRTLEPALVRARRLLGPAELSEALSILEDELAIADSDAARADVLAERARVCERLGRLPEARAAYALALKHLPRHAAALRGIESVLRRELDHVANKTLATELSVHLEHLAEAYAPGQNEGTGDAGLAAWIHVERAQILDEQLVQPAPALSALQRAVALEPSPGPVRDALTRHLIVHGRLSGLVESLAVEADRERDEHRAARLLYTAARILIDDLHLPNDAIGMLQRASARAPAKSPASRRILAELIRLLEAQGELDKAAGVRRKQLLELTDPEAIAHANVRLAEIYDVLGQADQAVTHAERALEKDPEDDATRERLDRALQRLGKHEQRVKLWVQEGNSDRSVPIRIAALLRAGDIANRRLHRRDEAIAWLRSAWAIDPSHPRVFDALSALLSPPAREADELRAVRARLDLYLQAAQATTDPARKVGLLEKVESIWEDEVCQPARALEVLETILKIEPDRRTAILAMQRNAERAGDAQTLARAIAAEAKLTADPRLKIQLLLRAAQVLGDRAGDRDRALTFVEQALAVDPADADALRALWQHSDKAGRHDEAKQALRRLIAREPEQASSFTLWLEVARLEEHRLRNFKEGVQAYQHAAALKPGHPLPGQEIVRLLRDAGDFRRLVDALQSLAAMAKHPADYAYLLFQAAEVQEFALKNDDAALRHLAKADALIANVADDPAIIEAMARIYVRKSARVELSELYPRWIERNPPPHVEHALHIAQAGVLMKANRTRATTLLEAFRQTEPKHLPALRMLQQLRRVSTAHAELADVLRAEADSYASSLARCGVLWELVALEDHVGPAATLDALHCITTDEPADVPALDAIVRVAGRLEAGDTAAQAGSASAPASRDALIRAIDARKELTRDPIARAMYELEKAMLIEADAGDDPAASKAALAGYHGALTLWPESLLAARGLSRMAERLDEPASAILSQLALARLADTAPRRAGHFVRAAEICLEDPRSEVQATELYERALRTDPDCAPATQSLARILSGDPGRLVLRLGEAIEHATSSAQIVLLGTEIARASLTGDEAAGGTVDPGAGVAAMRRVLAVVPDDVDSIMLMARLLSATRAWPEARDALLRAVHLAPHGEARITAYFELTAIYEGPLGDLANAQRCLQEVLAIDSANRRALEWLHKVSFARGDRSLGVQALARLADCAPDVATRVEIDLRLAEACREAGDSTAMVRAYCDAIIGASPGDLRAWTLLARLYRSETPDGATAYAAALQQLLDMATTRHAPLEPRWLSTLGLLEVTTLLRARDGIAHLQQGAALPGAPPDARVALGRGLEAAGRNAEAVKLLRDIFTNEVDTLARIFDLNAALASLDAALAKDGRADERLAVEEARACLGDVQPDRLARLRNRRLVADAPRPMSLGPADIGRLLVPEARSPMLNVAAAIGPIAAKALRFELAHLGVSSRERIGSRDSHPTRQLADRIARALGVESFELYVSPAWQAPARVCPGDPPAIVCPYAFAELPEGEQAFALARLLLRAALGPTWIEDLAIEAQDGMLIAALRTVAPAFGSGELPAHREQAVQTMFASVQKAIGRRQRKLLEEILSGATATYDPRALITGVLRSECRLAYLLSGDLVAAVDYMRRIDRDLGRAGEDTRVLLQHPVTSELIRYALSEEAYAERRRMGMISAGV